MEIQNKEMHRITSTAIIYKEENGVIKYLVTQRALNKKAFPGKWTVPGGGLEVDDYINTPKTTSDHWYFAIEKSLGREVKEEVGLEIEAIRYLLNMVFIRPDGVPAIILSFYAKYKTGEVILDEDTIDYSWATVEECKNHDLIEGIYEEIEMVEKILKGEKFEDVVDNNDLRKIVE